jgi:5-methylcytosine-specific restriction endonuclease McrA
MYHYRFPGIHIESRYNWTWPTLLLAIAFVIGLLLIARQFAPQYPRQFKVQDRYFTSTHYNDHVWRPVHRPTHSETRYPSPRVGTRDEERESPPARPARPPPPTQTSSRIGERLYYYQRRAKRRRLTKAQKRALLLKQRGRCAMCGKSMADWEVCIDHRIPLASQHLHSDNLNGDWNLWAICVSPCHALKTHRERQQGLYRQCRG